MHTVQISEEEGRLKKDEEETKEMWKRKREHEEKWEETRDKRVSLQSICRNLKSFISTGHIYL